MTVLKFTAIEGLRAWLAWTVVVSHLIQTTDLFRVGIGKHIWHAGGWAVLVFIIISGFVITHLILEKREQYSVYIGNRFMRLFPAFAVSCLLGALTMPLYLVAIEKSAWQFDPWYHQLISELVKTQTDLLWQHILAHATMLHGALNHATLPYSNYALSGVTWSISLEWQFYLVAPFVILLATDRRFFPLLVAAVVAGSLMYQRGWLGQYQNLSVLPAAAPYFMVGIVCRLALPSLRSIAAHVSPVLISVALIALMPIGNAATNVVLAWAAFFCFCCIPYKPENQLEAAAYTVFSLCFESRIATYLGSRSYSVYVFHFIVISTAQYLLTDWFSLATRETTLLLLAPIVIALTLLASDLSYRFIERPGIRLGRLMFASKRFEQTT